MPAPLIERYRERLPLEPGDPVVSLNEGSTPLVEAPVISERVGASVYLKLEGANPTGSFKDRGMTVAVSRAKGAGAEAIICASTGNTAASAAAYAARAGLRGAVIVPEGKIAQGKLAQAVIHGARVVALRGNFDQALEIVKQIGERQPVELVHPINPARWSEALRALDEAGGRVEAVSDDEILDAQRWLASNEGVFCEPASAACVAGVLKQPPEGALLVCVLTGHGLKDPDAALRAAPAVIGCDP